MDKNWNNDIQDLFDIVDLGLRKMRNKGKITDQLYTEWCSETELSSIGKLKN